MQVWEDNIIIYVEVVWFGKYSFGLRCGPVSGSCDSSNELRVYKDEELLDKLSYCFLRRSPFDELIQIDSLMLRLIAGLCLMELIQTGKPFDAASHSRSLFDGVNTDRQVV
jgi:hypothetical protein